MRKMSIDSFTMKAAFVRIILSVNAVHWTRLFSYNASQAYLQIKEKLSFLVYFQPKKANSDLIGLGGEKLFEFVRLLYDLGDAGDIGVTLLRTIL